MHQPLTKHVCLYSQSNRYVTLSIGLRANGHTDNEFGGGFFLNFLQPAHLAAILSISFVSPGHQKISLTIFFILTTPMCEQ